MRCGCNFTVAAALVPLLKPLRRMWDSLENLSLAAKRRLRIVYVLASAILCWVCLGIAERQGLEWFAFALLSIVYLAFITLFLIWIVPPARRVRFAQRRKPLERVGLIFNYLTLLLLLQTFMATWTRRAVMLGVLFVVSWIAFVFFLECLYPTWCGMSRVVFPPGQNDSFDPTAGQGRRARHD
jgi:hypothetical protein